MQLFRQGVAIFAALLLAIPGWGASDVVGIVRDSSAVVVRGAPVVAGTTIFSNDKIEVGAHGKVLIALAGGAEVQLLANSKASIRKPANAQALQLTVVRGIARFRSTEQTPIEAILADATIRPASGTAGAGYLSVISPTSVVIGAEKGAMLVTTDHNGSTVTVPEGTAMSVGLKSDDSDTKPVFRTHPLLIVIVGAILIGGIVGVAVAANQSQPSANKGAVSPLKP